MEAENKKKSGVILISVISVIALISVFTIDPIAQDVAYHRFSDNRQIIGIPNFWNVISNLAFLLVGVFGTSQLLSGAIKSRLSEIQFAYIALYLAVVLVSLGSGFYHLQPENQTLLWDRLPMTVAFMGLFTVIIGEFASVKIGKQLFLPLVIAGVGSVIYWHMSELNGQGDLRFYLLVQFLPMLLIPVFLLCFTSPFDRVYAYWWLLLSYIIAKLLEHFDAEVFSLLGFISGHSLKHIVAATGLYLLLNAYRRRKLINS